MLMMLLLMMMMVVMMVMLEGFDMCRLGKGDCHENNTYLVEQRKIKSAKQRTKQRQRQKRKQ
jgi:hypothetical protein